MEEAKASVRHDIAQSQILIKQIDEKLKKYREEPARTDDEIVVEKDAIRLDDNQVNN